MIRANVSSAARAAAGGIAETLGIFAVLAIRLYSDTSDTAGHNPGAGMCPPFAPLGLEEYVSYRLS